MHEGSTLTAKDGTVYHVTTNEHLGEAPAPLAIGDELTDETGAAVKVAADGTTRVLIADGAAEKTGFAVGLT